MPAVDQADRRSDSRSGRLNRSLFPLESPPLAPANDTESRLARIWQDVLAVDGLGVEDDFFQLGGDSFVAVLLLGEIEREFGEALALSTLVDCRTVRSLALHLERSGKHRQLVRYIPVLNSRAIDYDECLLPFRPKGSLPPIFIVHGVHCVATFVQLLLAHLGEDQPVYGFQGVGLNGGRPPLETIEAMAARYIGSLRRVQPRGPYALSGFCLGGHVAMEMAHQLLNASEEISRLFLIDTPATLDPVLADQVIGTAIQTAKQRLESWPQTRQHLAGAPATVTAFGEAVRNYKPKVYSGKVHILANEVAAARMRHPDLGWSKRVPPNTPIHIVAPTHESIVQLGLPAIGQYIDGELRRMAGHPGPTASAAPPRQ